MALVLADRVRETSTSTGTTTITLGGAYTGFQTFSATVGNGNTTYYTIANVVTGEWEVGIGTYTSSGNTLSRDTVLASSNSGSLVNFTSGSKDVFITQPSERAVYVNGTSVVAANGAVLGTANGGTNLSSFTANGVMYASSTSALTTGSALQFDGANLGLGVTPSAWGLFTGLQVGPSGSISNNGTGTPVTVVSNNAYYNGTSWAYINTAAASQYQLSTSQHIWRYAASGSGNITWSEAMRLDASGNLLVGTTTATEKITVNGRVACQWNAYANGGTTSYSGDATSLVTGSSAGMWAARSDSALLFSISSAEKMRIDSSGNLGLGVTPNTWASTAKAFELYGGGSIYANASSNDLRIGCNVYISSAGTNTYKTTNAASFYYQAGGTHYWFNAPSGTAGSAITFTQAMTLNSSGNLGIGTTSPSAKLNVVGSGDMSGIFETTGTNNAASVIVRSGNATTSGLYAYARFVNNDTNGQDWRIGTYGTNNLSIVNAKAGTTPIVLDTSGNLGLGVTPSAWSSSWKAFQFGSSGALVSESTANTRLYANTYFDGTNNKYINNDAATLYYQVGGTHRWYYATTGTAGATFSFSEAMRIDSSGNLGVGLTSPSARLDAYQATQVNSTFRAYGPAGQILWANGGASTSYLDSDTIIFRKSSNSSNTETMRIDSSGNLLVATTASTNGKLTILKNSLYNSQSGHGIALLSNDNNAYTSMYMGADDTSNIGYIQTAQHNTGYARDLAINPNGGNLLVGTTATVNSCKAVLAWSSSTQNGITFDDAYTGAATANPVYFRRNGSNVGTISTTTTTTAYNTSSDYRLKNVTGNLTGYKERVMSLQPRQGTWKIDGSEFRGFLAHEFAGPYRSSVTGEKDAVDADGNPVMQAMQASSSEVMADLVALVQELVAENQSLKARLDAANL